MNTLAERQALVISPQVLNEFCNASLSKFRHVPREEIREAVESLSQWCTAETSVVTALRALDLQATMHVSFYDAVLLSSAFVAGCTYFLSEDLQHDRLVGDMRIVNPFAVAPDAILRDRT